MTLKLNGVGRDADYQPSLILYFDRSPTDEELRFIHETLRAALSGPDWPPARSAIGRWVQME